MNTQRRKDVVNASQVAFAINTQAKLNAKHKEFIGFVSSWKNNLLNGGSFTVEGDDLFATVLGIDFHVIRRLVGSDGQLIASEYAFVTKHNGEDLCLWCIYLDDKGNLFADPAFDNRLCDFNNPSLPTTVVNQLAHAVLKSPIIAPRTVFTPPVAVVSTNKPE